jgi:alkanesulfonate monooxygenase SsuD/methylene tetrahydromethanopterin reductase-like flavin-dependent oxidoreductase (luciferase family)
MVPVVIGESAAEVEARCRRAAAIFPPMPRDEAGWRRAGFLYGSPESVVADLKRWEALGMQRVMLQMLDQDDVEALELIARAVLPGVRR